MSSIHEEITSLQTQLSKIPEVEEQLAAVNAKLQLRPYAPGGKK